MNSHKLRVFIRNKKNLFELINLRERERERERERGREGGGMKFWYCVKKLKYWYKHNKRKVKGLVDELLNKQEVMLNLEFSFKTSVNIL